MKVLFLCITAGFALACAPAFAPAFTPVPTFDVNSVGTAIVETANAAATQTQFFITPTATPTFTLTPTKTPTETITPSPTFIFILNSPTPSATPLPAGSTRNTPYACELVSQTPEDNSIMLRGAPFSMSWVIRNVGTTNWVNGSIDYLYKSGDKLHLQAAYDLRQDVSMKGVVEIKVGMAAPNEPGTYQTTWTLRAGKREFCRLTLTIRVN